MSQQQDTNNPIESGEQLFNERHVSIIEKYGKDLPRPESTLKFSLVIPALSELKNGHLWMLLDIVR